MSVRWTAHPARRRPAELALFVAVACVTLAGIGYLFESGFLTVLAGVFLVVGVAPFLFPTRYEIDADGVSQTRLGHRRERRWADLRRVEVGSGAALVSPFARRSWLDRHRGLILYFDGGDREQVIAALRERIPVNEQEVAALEAELSDEERSLLDELAEGLAKRRLASAALMFAESVKPLGFIGSQMLHFFRPIISVLWSNPARYDQVTKILERRGSLELLCRRLEARS